MYLLRLLGGGCQKAVKLLKIMNQRHFLKLFFGGLLCCLFGYLISLVLAPGTMVKKSQVYHMPESRFLQVTDELYGREAQSLGSTDVDLKYKPPNIRPNNNGNFI